MELKPKFGFEQLLFGMKQKDVEKVYGKPDVVFKDEDGNQIALYFKLKARLTFYEDEDFKLGYCIISNQNLTLFDEKIIGRPTSALTSQDGSTRAIGSIPMPGVSTRRRRTAGDGKR